MRGGAGRGGGAGHASVRSRDWDLDWIGEGGWSGVVRVGFVRIGSEAIRLYKQAS